PMPKVPTRSAKPAKTSAKEESWSPRGRWPLEWDDKDCSKGRRCGCVVVAGQRHRAWLKVTATAGSSSSSLSDGGDGLWRRVARERHDTTASSVDDLYSGRGNEGSGRNKVDAGSSGKQRGHGSSEGWQPRRRCQQRRRGRWWSTDLKDSERSIAIIDLLSFNNEKELATPSL
ncbi:hypothetical protein BHM03_00033562, partial [Ensete ventricosum]